MVQVSRRKARIARRVGVNENGRRIGETHHRAKLTDADVELILELWDDGRGLSYGAIARKFDDQVTVSKSHVREICQGTKRGQQPVRFKVVCA